MLGADLIESVFRFGDYSSQVNLERVQIQMARMARKLEPTPYEKWSKDQRNLIWWREELSPFFEGWPSPLGEDG